MPRTSRVCGHPQRAVIDEAITAGGSFRNIAEQFGPSPQSLLRHRQHMAGAKVEHRRVRDAFFSQEYECAFTSMEGAVFSVEDVQAAFRREVEPWADLMDIWHGQSSSA